MQVFISYGPVSNLKLICYYGFVIPNNPHDLVPLQLEVRAVLLVNRLIMLDWVFVLRVPRPCLIQLVCVRWGAGRQALVAAWCALACSAVARPLSGKCRHLKGRSVPSFTVLCCAVLRCSRQRASSPRSSRRHWIGMASP